MTRLVVLLLAVSVQALSAGPQARPAFAGTWALAAEQSRQLPDQLKFIGFGQTFTVAQDEERLRVTRSLGGVDRTEVYNLDGSESINPLRLGGRDFERRSRVTWRGPTLVISSTSTSAGRPPSEGEIAMSLDGAGRLVLMGGGRLDAVLKYERK